MRCETEKREEWGYWFVFSICSLLLVTMVLGFHFSLVSGMIAAMGFLLLSAANLYGAFCATCRHCCYYGKRCYMALGLIVPYLFKKVEEPATDLKMGLWMALFVVNILYPLIFIYKENPFFTSFVYSVTYLIPPVVGVVLVTRFSCPRCKNIYCLSNPDRTKELAMQ
jgi:hypothetical protein